MYCILWLGSDGGGNECVLVMTVRRQYTDLCGYIPAYIELPYIAANVTDQCLFKGCCFICTPISQSTALTIKKKLS